MICEVYDNIFDARYLHEFFDDVITRTGYNITNIANRKTNHMEIQDLTVYLEDKFFIGAMLMIFKT